VSYKWSLEVVYW